METELLRLNIQRYYIIMLFISSVCTTKYLLILLDLNQHRARHLGCQ